ncbi:MAG: DUF1573 domain-containing protein [Flavobacteriales bacterium]
MKGKILLLLTAFAGTLALSSCNESTEQVSKPISDAASVAQNASNKVADANSNLSKKNDAKTVNANKDQSTSSELLPKTTVSFDSVEHDFGVIDEGDKVEHIFKFTNTGTEALILEKCKGSCGCTVPECPKEPIAPGAEGEIKVVFNSKGKKNSQTKKVTITSNTEPIQSILTIKAQVTPEPAAE